MRYCSKRNALGAQFGHILIWCLHWPLLRLANSERNVRAELENFKTVAMASENELRHEISKLQQLIQDSAPVGFRLTSKCPITYHLRTKRNTPLQDLRDPNGELPVELATPFPASAILPANAPVVQARSPYIDPPSIPLPPSPILTESTPSSPIPSAISKQPRSSRKSKETQIGLIESALVDARRDLEEKESALDDLRALVGELRQQVVSHGGLEGVDNYKVLSDTFR